jgi:tetratricopeptide (TPR) repeat protein
MTSSRSRFIIGILCIVVVLEVIVLFNNYRLSHSALSDLDPKSLDGKIQTLEAVVKDDPETVDPYVRLSQAYMQKVRETADISYYKKIDDLMTEAEKINPNDPEIWATRANLALGRHHFPQAQIYIKKALSFNNTDDDYYGILGDSQVELGQYQEAVESFQKMMNIRPSYSSYTRVAYIRELNGDIVGAKKAFETAIISGSGFAENIAWAYVELGKLEMRSDLQKAKQHFTNALKIVENYPPANEGLGKVAFFENNLAEAENYFQKAYDALPLAAYATDLGDLYKHQGITDKANQYYTLAELAFDASKQAGTNHDLEYALFLADHDINLPVALEKAKQAYSERRSIYTADYLSWAYYKNGDINKASTYTKEALRLGLHDPVILFHQGMIAAKKGNRGNAKKYLTTALKIHPYFSIHDVKIAQEMLNSLK